ncbi:AT-hook motif nuclear-localized protein 17 [Dichanthelium oligosanthes]|uniref:AT-hook motif nuclear-localized protein 17 n=1 Tax=Dichanthelium oligosanthes TaxID=888268 RepID=A0A1E5VCR1_9POAL|nr:AT-hook motif nuclear-localized protein 17 [Dichanthelium oligosanthes]
MSLGKRDMSQERTYQDRKDVVPIHFTTPPPQPQPSQQHHHGGGRGEQQQQQQLECFSDEVDSRGSAELKEPTSGGALVVVSGGGDGASIEVSKKRRGRPPGSKNKPKPPVVITREAEPAAAMRPHVIEIPCGRDVADALARFATRRNLGICVLAGTGAVANVSLRNPTPGGGVPGGAPAAIVFHGQYEILSISATFLPPAMSAVAPQAAAAAACLSISLAGPHGQIVGGAVAGPLYAASTVVVVAAAFTNPTFHRLPLDDDASVSVSVSLSPGSGDPADEHRGGHHQQHQHPAEQAPQEHRPHVVRRQPPHLAAAASQAQPVDPCGPPVVPIFACHPQHQDVMWPPAARAPHPPPPPPY